MPTRPQPSPPLTTQEELGAVLPEILPEQGMWTDEQYLWLTDGSNRLVEFTDGYVEVLPMPTDTHQTTLLYLYERFVSFVRPRGGKVLVAALRLRIRPGKYREPDLLVLADANDPRREDRFWLGADLVVEVVSPDKPDRDLVTKRADYPEGGIPEYWIVDSRNEAITVLWLEGESYQEHASFGRGTMATSRLLEAFAVSVDEVFEAG
jgi:Uma2 family endonuclease